MRTQTQHSTNSIPWSVRATSVSAAVAVVVVAFVPVLFAAARFFS